VSTGLRVVRDGFRRDRTHQVAALFTWLLTLIVASAPVWPAWRWWSSALAYAPRGDVLVERVDLVVLKELVQFDRASTFGMVGAALFAGVILALLLNPLIAGGVLGLLLDASGGPRATRFFASGVAWYGRFARALIYVAVVAALALGLVVAGSTLVVDAVSRRGFEQAGLMLNLLQVMVLVGVAAFFTAVLDLTRARLVLTGSGGVLAASLTALRVALRHPGALARIGLSYALLLTAVGVGVVWLRAHLPGGGWGWLALAFVLQQAFSYVRLRLRVATLASLVALARAQLPASGSGPVPGVGTWATPGTVPVPEREVVAVD
jgi:hypothetical protein